MHTHNTGRVNSVRLLIENGANINAVNADNKTALISAIDSGKSHSWTSVNIYNCKRVFWLSGYTHVATLLIQKGADANRVGGKSGQTALMRAADKGKKVRKQP